MALSARRPTALHPRRSATPALVSLVVAAALAAPATAEEVPVGVWPLKPRPDVVHPFDPPEVRWGAGHRGVDLAGRVGQPVRAALPGTVSFAGRVAGRGVVVVDHGPTRTTYEPVAASVSRGTEVERGDVIGTLAWFGTHCIPAACLHWGLVAGETYLDPLRLVDGPQPVRLLPLTGAAPLGVRPVTPVRGLASPAVPVPAVPVPAVPVVPVVPAVPAPSALGAAAGLAAGRG